MTSAPARRANLEQRGRAAWCFSTERRRADEELRHREPRRHRRRQPRHGRADGDHVTSSPITEPNYLPFVEFYDEDFALAIHAGGCRWPDRLRPWLWRSSCSRTESSRAVSVRCRFRHHGHQQGRTAASRRGIWLWAHVHSNADIPDSDLNDFERFLLSLNQTRNDDPDQFYCRLMSPRHLKANTAYTAFVVPAFETEGAGSRRPRRITRQDQARESTGAVVDHGGRCKGRAARVLRVVLPLRRERRFRGARQGARTEADGSPRRHPRHGLLSAGFRTRWQSTARDPRDVASGDRLGRRAQVAVHRVPLSSPIRRTHATSRSSYRRS